MSAFPISAARITSAQDDLFNPALLLPLVLGKRLRVVDRCLSHDIRRNGPAWWRGRSWSGWRVPDDDPLGRIIAGRVGDVAVDRPEFGSGERDRDIFHAG